MKLYIFHSDNPVTPWGDYGGYLMAEDGEVIRSHVSSSLGWLRNDLTRPAELDEKYPDGWDVVDMQPCSRVPDWMVEANKKWAEDQA